MKREDLVSMDVKELVLEDGVDLIKEFDVKENISEILVLVPFFKFKENEGFEEFFNKNYASIEKLLFAKLDITKFMEYLKSNGYFSDTEHDSYEYGKIRDEYMTKLSFVNFIKSYIRNEKFILDRSVDEVINDTYEELRGLMYISVDNGDSFELQMCIVEEFFRLKGYIK